MDLGGRGEEISGRSRGRGNWSGVLYKKQSIFNKKKENDNIVCFKCYGRFRVLWHADKILRASEISERDEVKVFIYLF